MAIARTCKYCGKIARESGFKHSLNECATCYFEHKPKEKLICDCGKHYSDEEWFQCSNCGKHII